MSDIVQEQLGPCTLSWRDGVFPLGSDALMLGRFAAVKPGWRVCDLGTGSGVLLLLLAGRTEKLSLTGVELDPLSAQTARGNLGASRPTVSPPPCPPAALTWWSPTRPTFPWAAEKAEAPPGLRSSVPWTSCAPPPDGW